MALAILGAFVVGVILVWFSVWYGGTLFLAVGFAGWSCLKEGWQYTLAHGMLLAVCWYGYIALLFYSFSIHISIT